MRLQEVNSPTLLPCQNAYLDICLACLNHHKDMLWQSDIISTALNGMGGGRTDAEREAQGSY